MRKITGLFFILLASMAFIFSAGFPDTKTFLLLPLNYHGPEAQQYIQTGIHSMLRSRLARGNILPGSTDSLKNLTSKDINGLKKAQNLLQSSGVDILFWGDVTVIQDQVSIDLNQITTDKKIQSISFQSRLDNLISDMGLLADQIHNQLCHKTVKAEKTIDSESTVSQELPDKKFNFQPLSKEARVEPILSKSEDPAFSRQNQPEKWKSQTLSLQAIGAVIEDVNADGIQEALVLEEHRLSAYHIGGKNLSPVSEYKFSASLKCLNLNVIDLNNDKWPEIVISAVQNNEANSVILNLKEKQFVKLHDNIKFYLNQIRIPPGFEPKLIAQGSADRNFFKNGIYEFIYNSGEYQLGPQIQAPQEANVFNCIFIPHQDSYKIVLTDKKNHLRVYNSEHEFLYSSETEYGASPLSIEGDNTLSGMEKDHKNRTVSFYYYIPTRLIPFKKDVRKDRFHLLAASNISTTGGLRMRYPSFSRSFLSYLVWDGFSLNPLWKLENMNGTIRDYGIADVDNDNVAELFVCLNTRAGLLGINRVQSFFLFYEIEQPLHH
jgi:hypothetical protein